MLHNLLRIQAILCIFFHGESDNMVPAILSKEFSKIRSNIKIFLMKKTEHGLTEVGDEEFLSNISIENMKKS